MGAGEGSIPAQAGEPRSRAPARSRPGVYPRAGGGTICSISRRAMATGLSPRRRGNPWRTASSRSRMRSIPAQAGEPGPSRRCRSRHRVYPRAGGGTCGERAVEPRDGGLSPRRRGNRADPDDAHPRRGSIPAQAGEPSRGRRCGTMHRVYPRAGGGTFLRRTGEDFDKGLSPRRRGNPASWSSAPSSSWVYPRAGGGTHRMQRLPPRVLGLSPRRRGNHRPGKQVALRLGSIPAQAGEPGSPCRRRPRNGVYPRAGGGTGDLP